MSCVFCRIVEAHADSEIVWDEETVLAFMDVNPVTTGHLLVVPKRHYVGLDDIEPRTAARMMQVAQRLTRALKDSSLPCEGVNVFFADGEAAFQEVFHSHLHVFPRHPGDGFRLKARWEGSSAASRRPAADAVLAALGLRFAGRPKVGECAGLPRVGGGEFDAPTVTTGRGGSGGSAPRANTAGRRRS